MSGLNEERVALSGEWWAVVPKEPLPMDAVAAMTHQLREAMPGKRFVVFGEPVEFRPLAPLDAAWAEVEAALPKGWVMEAGDTATGGYWAQAYGPEVENQHPQKDGFGPTPTAALLELAAKLRS